MLSLWGFNFPYPIRNAAFYSQQKSLLLCYAVSKRKKVKVIIDKQDERSYLDETSNIKSSYINELVNLDRLINCRHLIYRISSIFVEYNHKNDGNLHKIKAQMLNTFSESANELDLINDRDNLKQLIENLFNKKTILSNFYQ